MWGGAPPLARTSLRATPPSGAKIVLLLAPQRPIKFQKKSIGKILGFYVLRKY